MHEESNERRDSKLPDGSHQSPFSFGGVVPVGGRGHGGPGGGREGRHQALNLNKLIDFPVPALLRRTSSLLLANRQHAHGRQSPELLGISTLQ